MNERPGWQPVRGARDVPPTEQLRLRALQQRLENIGRQWGYQPIDVPLLEQRDLYLKKAGEELVGKLYDFVHHGRALALRPEWTSSVLRAYLRLLRSEPLPVRLAYSGPVLRYERPQRTTYRQFTQVGVELIGGVAPLADAEILGLACLSLDAVGVKNWKLTVGHIGIARTLLAAMRLPERTASQLLWSFERLRREPAQVRAELMSDEAPELFDLGPLQSLPDDQLQHLLLTMLRAVGVPVDNTSREPEAIVARLVRKLRRSEPAAGVEQALAVLTQLSAIRMQPREALQAAAQLLGDEGLSAAPIQELQATLDLLLAQGMPLERIVIDLGMSRGLHYYTGIIFEIEGEDGLQLCGGGRYDDLIASLGGPTTPAVGFAFGLERIAAVAEQRPVVEQPSLVVMTPTSRHAEGLRVAEYLRQRGFLALLDVRGRSLQANLRDAMRRGARAVVEVEDEQTVVWHDVWEGARRGNLAEVVPHL